MYCSVMALIHCSHSRYGHISKLIEPRARTSISKCVFVNRMRSVRGVKDRGNNAATQINYILDDYWENTHFWVMTHD